ncbi:MAG: hypothetical protein OXH59_03135, partial [Rhodospirillaceae bacterium]|nr:hypothetical protein [Rhodospirillaceae bacterium]
MTVDCHRGSNGAGNDKLYGDAVCDRLDGSRATISLNTCPRGMGARLSRLLHIALPSASRGWRRAVCALAAALLLLLGAGGVAAQDTLPTVSVSDAEAYEDGKYVHFEVSLSQASSEQVTVEVATSSGTAWSGTDFRAEFRTVTFPAHSTDPQSVLVSLRDDRTREPDETFTVTLTNPVGATLGDATATGTIRNDDTSATLAANGIGETSATLTIGSNTAGWWYEGGEYSVGLGYGGQAWRIFRRSVHPCTAVPAGTTAVSIGGLAAAMAHDYRAYSDSTCSTRLAKVKFRTLAPEGTPTVNVSDAEVSEDGDWMDFKVSLSQGSRERVTVRVHTSSGTATSGADFRDVSRTLTFPANSGTPLSVRVFVHDDEESEPDETFTVRLTNPVGATLGDATATGTIKDDGDTAAALTSSDIEDTTATLTIARRPGREVGVVHPGVGPVRGLLDRDVERVVAVARREHRAAHLEQHEVEGSREVAGEMRLHQRRADGALIVRQPDADAGLLTRLGLAVPRPRHGLGDGRAGGVNGMTGGGRIVAVAGLRRRVAGRIRLRQVLGLDQSGDDLEFAVAADGGDAARHREVLAPPHGAGLDGALDLVEAGFDAPGFLKQFLGPRVVVEAAELVVAGFQLLDLGALLVGRRPGLGLDAAVGGGVVPPRLDHGHGPFPAGGQLVGGGLELVGRQLLQQHGVLEPDAVLVLVGEQVAHDRAAGGLVGLHADEPRHGGRARHALLGQEALHLPGGGPVALGRDLFPDRHLALAVGGDGEGLQHLEVVFARVVGAQRHPLAVDE